MQFNLLKSVVKKANVFLISETGKEWWNTNNIHKKDFHKNRIRNKIDRKSRNIDILRVWDIFCTTC